MAGAFVGKGSSLQLDVGGEYTTIADVVSISGPSQTVGTVETTDLASSAKEYLPTILDAGEITATINYDPGTATHANLSDLLSSPAVKGWKIIFSNTDGSVYAFNGILTGFSVSGVAVEEIVTAEISIKLSGAVTITV